MATVAMSAIAGPSRMRDSTSSLGSSDHVYSAQTSHAVNGNGDNGMAALTSWDRMRLAKMALMQAEEAEARRKSENRKARRASQAIGLGLDHINDEGSSRRLSASTDISTVSSTHRVAPPPTSILRRQTDSSFTASPSSSSLDSYTSLPPPISRFASAHAIDFCSQYKQRSTSQIIPLRRRSSRVRFSDESSSSSGIELGSPTSTSSLRRLSSVDRLHEDLARSTRVLSLDVDIDPFRLSTASFSSIASDQFSLSSPLTRVSIPEIEDGFVPQALSYPRIARRASRISISSLSSQGDSGPASSSTSFSSAGAPSGALLAMVNRPSLSHSPQRSVSIAVVPNVRGSFGSIASTLLSTSPSSYNGSMARSLSDISIDLPRGMAYNALLPSAEATPNPDRVPTINRKDWDPELGLSPRSGPTPIAVQTGVMADPLDFNDVASPLSPVAHGSIITLEMTNPFNNSVVVATFPHRAKAVGEIIPASRETALDSIDLLPATSPDTATGKGHRRIDSTLSAVLNFPLPPSRMFEVAAQAGSPIADEASHSDDQSGPSEICLDTPRPDFAVSIFALPPTLPVASEPSPPTSPTLGEMVAQTRRKSQWSDEDVELGISSPLLDAAVSSGILSPTSSKFSPSPTRLPRIPRLSSSSSDHLRSGLMLTRGRGWSGSESEEEEFAQALRSIALRKLAAPRPKGTRSLSTGTQSSGASGSGGEGSSRLYSISLNTARPSLQGATDRLSQLSNSSSARSGPDSAGPLTPDPINNIPMSTQMALSLAHGPKTPPIPRPASAASNGSTVPGDYPWGRSSAPASPTGSIRSKRSGQSSGRNSGTSSPQRSFYEDLSSSLAVLGAAPVSSGLTARSTLPRPTRKVEGWGRPEVLMDEQWDVDPMWDRGDEMDGVDIKSGRAGSPDMDEMMARGRLVGHGKLASLFDETLDEVGVAL